MYLKDYFTTLLNLDKWLKDWEEQFVKFYNDHFDIASQMSHVPEILSSYLTISGYIFVFFKEEMDNIIALASYLDVKIHIEFIFP